MKKKIAAGCIALASMAGLAACGTAEVTQSSIPGSLSAKKESKAEYTIGICQLVQHEDCLLYTSRCV